MRFLKRFLYVAGGLVVVVAIGLWLAVRASLPQLDGVRILSGLAAPVTISRDAIGVVTIRAAQRRDAALATGFVHAQERLFQMDLMRRLAAGELAALVGEAAAGHDVLQRVHRMRSVARRVMDRAHPEERAIIEAYAAGVNAGIDALAVRPFEYLILRALPQPWRAEDTVLVVMAMYFRLHDERASRESRLGRLHGSLPPQMYAFLTQAGTPWDAPLVGAASAGLAVPGAGVCDVRRVEHNPLAAAPERVPGGLREAAAVGSNAWAIAPPRTRGGVAMVANDMHLGLAVPNTWFRLRLRIHGPGRGVDVSGVTLPGTPAIVAGSNGRVAWGLSNSYGDWVDLVELEVDPEDPDRYLTPDGYRRFDEHVEVIHIQGAAARTHPVRGTIWGPVIDGGGGGAGPRALRWLAHDAEATNLVLLEMEHAGDVQEALAVARRSGIPPQNLLLADSGGNIAWTVAGRMPRRRGYDPLLPGSWAAPGHGWFGFVAPEDYPEVVNPSAGAIWTANARVVDGDALALIGDGGYALGARARQIRDRLLSLEDAAEADMLAIQLDDRATFLAPWRQLLLDLLDGDTAPRRAELRRVVEAGGHRAAIDDAGYRLVRAFRREVAQRAFAAILVGCASMDPGAFPAELRQWEGPLWRIVQERPPHLLAPGHDGWDSFLLEAADAAAGSCGAGELERCTWGEANRLRIRHPLSRALPVLSRWLDLPGEALPGDLHMPRVQAPAMGASLRFAVAPGRESSGYLHMPGGQSGHPLSPFYDEGHRAWINGEATPFLPGPERHRLTLEPPG